MLWLNPKTKSNLQSHEVSNCGCWGEVEIGGGHMGVATGAEKRTHISITQKMQIARWTKPETLKAHTSDINSVSPLGSTSFPNISINSGASLQVPKFLLPKCQFSNLSWQIWPAELVIKEWNFFLFYRNQYFKHPWEWVFIPENL